MQYKSPIDYSPIVNVLRTYFAQFSMIKTAWSLDYSEDESSGFHRIHMDERAGFTLSAELHYTLLGETHVTFHA